MKNFQLVFLGTGAADWPYHPAVDDRLDKNKQIRRTSSVWMNGHILIDPAPESYFFAKNVLKLDLSKISDIFLTHSHEDHFDRDALKNFLKEAKGKVRFFCHEQTIPFLKLDQEILDRTELHPLQVKSSVRVDNLSIVPLAANHEIVETAETALHYEFEMGGDRILYGCDGGWFLSNTWSYLMGRELGGIVLDATVGEYADDFRIASHNTLPMIRMLVPAMRKNRVIREDSAVILSHFAKTLHNGIKETEEKMKKEGMICAYDGFLFK